MSKLEEDARQGWFQLSDHPADVRSVIQYNARSRPPPSPAPLDVSSQQLRLIPTTSCVPDPPPSDVKYLSTAGPLPSEMKYPEIHTVPHGAMTMKYPEIHAVPRGGTTRSSYRRTRHGSIGVAGRAAMLSRPATVDRDLHQVPAAAQHFSAAGSLRRKSTDTGRPREMAFSTRPPGDYSQKRDLSPPGDWSAKRDRTAMSELEYRV